MPNRPPPPPVPLSKGLSPCIEEHLFPSESVSPSHFLFQSPKCACRGVCMALPSANLQGSTSPTPLSKQSDTEALCPPPPPRHNNNKQPFSPGLAKWAPHFSHCSEPPPPQTQWVDHQPTNPSAEGSLKRQTQKGKQVRSPGSTTHTHSAWTPPPPSAPSPVSQGL